MTEPEKSPDDLILMQLDGVGRIAVALPRVKLGSRAASTLSPGGFHARNCPPNPLPPP
ncbi:hypothetical protein ECWI1_2244 [Escherichia coli]|nr:hypothetical protein ECWI1_2244 [Escherichia coli]